ncbi:hypothetical protein [Phenylobacterium deserti]|uniref:Superoxide dismutase n=1 Tax=Phenylobacterium deserti TaxID=1914756 RepID=A0A328ADN3_9CAUL|nr:hypothetical protein [Phenylobacterium deserti]RAK50838.1 hypothetical protein DJ018_16835 [Phenylobacterium deserti]
MIRASLLLACLLATSAGAQTGARYALPAEVRHPEGIAYDPARGMIFTASAVDGTLAVVDARTGAARAIAAPEIARQIGETFPGALGMKLDPRGRLWIAGGRTGKVFVVDPTSGRLIQTLDTTGSGAGLINDLVFVGDRAYLTDTFRPILWTVAAGERIGAAPERFVEFAGTPLQYGEGANLNGITATPDGRTLLVGQMNKGLLFRIDIADRKVSPIDLGGETAPGADGLILKGDLLYVIRQPAAEIVTVRLAPNLLSGKVLARTQSAGLLWPATGVIVGDELVAVNSQFNRRNSGELEQPFTLQRVPLADLGR